MDINNVYIRTALPEDAKDLLDIYIPYIKNTAITFEYEIPSLFEFRERIINTLQKYPYLVAVSEDQIIGYAYAGPFKKRAAYDWAVESTIYLKNDLKHMGLGRMLYNELEKILKEQNILNIYACVAYPEANDKYLTLNSAQFHEHMGYSVVGKFNKCGYKFGKWYDMVWMEKIIGDHNEKPCRFIPFTKLKTENQLV